MKFLIRTKQEHDSLFKIRHFMSEEDMDGAPGEGRQMMLNVPEGTHYKGRRPASRPNTH